MALLSSFHGERVEKKGSWETLLVPKKQPHETVKYEIPYNWMFQNMYSFRLKDLQTNFSKQNRHIHNRCLHWATLQVNVIFVASTNLARQRLSTIYTDYICVCQFVQNIKVGHRRIARTMKSGNGTKCWNIILKNLYRRQEYFLLGKMCYCKRLEAVLGGERSFIIIIIINLW